MLKKQVIAGIASLGLVLGDSAIATPSPHNHQQGQFHYIEQPISNKIIVTVGGLGLIGLEVWWFLLSRR
jgi:plastocyanin domain-containing protein